MNTTTKVSAASMWRSSRSYAIVSNRRGQMALFVALLFQILFVFFAMVVNVGLLVHDKINLQNSVDLGA
ncbi:MAG TPA: pilus assembly protein TadG-related protein, partial [Bdellovibrionales bacterium]|nr:pilus assembly protein TadG-related protein [Bdellovibrionales bacterium]